MNTPSAISGFNRFYNHTAREARRARVRVRIKRRLRKAGLTVPWDASISELRALSEAIR